jgi:hypothetical protein
MIPFTTTDDQRMELYQIAAEMAAAGLPSSFVVAAVKRAEAYEGTFDLMVLWREAAHDPDGEEEREQIIADLQEMIDEDSDSRPGIEEKPYIQFDELKSVADKVLLLKSELRKKVDAWGGINKLARETGIPQPSLSRFFASAAMPRRTTLYRIAKALNLPERDIATDWIR